MNERIEEVVSYLGPTGPFAQQIPNFRIRPGQLRLAEAVADSLEHGSTLVAEAATGTGKTLAYLVPVLSSGLKVLISTGTRTLQDQLYQRDLPMALKTLHRGRTTALLKGRSNYLCVHRLELMRGAGRHTERRLPEQLEQVYAWSRATEHGEINELSSLSEEAIVWPFVTSTVDNCLGSECPSYSKCHLMKARRKAVEADVVVVNHHLLFADMALKEQGHGEVLPTVEAFVIDEAHQVPDTATRFFSRGLSSRQIRELVKDTQAASSKVSGGFGVVQEALSELEQHQRELILQFASMNDRGHGPELMKHAKIPGMLGDLDEHLGSLLEALEPMKEADRSVGNVHQRCERMRGVLKKFRAEDTEGVRWYEKRRQGFAVHVTPLDIAKPLANFRETRPAAWIFTSATLAVGQKFDHFTHRLGLEEAETLSVESPFDHRHNGLCWLPQGLPAPGDYQHTEKLLQTIWPLIEVSGGRAFLLFTTHRALQQAAQWLKTRCEYPLFIQGEGPRGQLVDDFRKAGNGILLGAASFWEGVDVPGAALSVVVIDKLPFAAPDDPVLQARLESIRAEGMSPFSKVQLPEAVLTLKQGAGRLIRAHGDCGVVVLGDPRLVQKGYGRLFLNSLPPWPRTREIRDAIDFMSTIMDVQKQAAQVPAGLTAPTDNEASKDDTEPLTDATDLQTSDNNTSADPKDAPQKTETP